MPQEVVFLPQVLHRTSLTTIITEDLTGVITMVITTITGITMVITITVLVFRIEIVGEVKNVALHLMDKELVPTLQIIMDNNKNVFSSAFSKNTIIWCTTIYIRFYKREKKSWEQFRICLINSTANPAQLD